MSNLPAVTFRTIVRLRRMCLERLASRARLPIVVIAATCLLAACASGPVVHTDRDPAADLGGARAYAWTQEPPIGNPLLKQRILSAVDAELSGKGWRRVAEQEADILLVGNVSSRDDVALNYFYDGNAWNGWDRPGVNRMQAVEVRTYRTGTLVLDMFDATSRRAVWRAVAEGSVSDSEERRTRDAMAAVHAMFEDFPPPATSAR